MEQLIVTPLKPFELILGKTIPFIIISQLQMILVIVFAILWFQIPMVGNAFLLLGATFIFLISTLGSGLFISTVSKTQQQAMMTNFFFHYAFFHVKRVCISDCQHADCGSMVYVLKSTAVLSGDRQGNFSQRNRIGGALASVFRFGDFRRDCLSGGGQSLSETSGLTKSELNMSIIRIGFDGSAKYN